MSDVLPTASAPTLLARRPTLAALAALEGYPAARQGQLAPLLSKGLSGLQGAVVADQYAYALLDAETQTLLSARRLKVLDTTDTAAVKAALEHGSLLYTTTIQQPYQTVPDLSALAISAQQSGAQLLIDATPTPLLTSLPAAAWAMHRHSALLLGRVDNSGVLLGEGTAVQADEWRPGLATLPARIRTHSGNAQAAADILAGHPQVRAVYYPGLGTHPQFERAAEQFPEGFGGLLSLEARQPEQFARALGRVWAQQPGFGTLHSTFYHSPAQPQLTQMWLGLEDISDLLSELEGALD